MHVPEKWLYNICRQKFIQRFQPDSRCIPATNPTEKPGIVISDQTDSKVCKLFTIHAHEEDFIQNRVTFGH